MQHTYIIGEIGQNHNGSVEIAKLLIDLIDRPVCDELFNINLKKIDAVKLTKRDLSQELSASQMKMKYDNPNSFGKTYGEHREFLELTNSQHLEIYNYAKSKGLNFIETLCSPKTLELLELFTPDYLKVASRDLTNTPLLSAMAETKIPLIISTGMADKTDLDNALETIEKYHSNISILHCVSQYPTHPDNVNLMTLQFLLENYSNYKIGYSDHTIGISTPVAAVAMGAQIIEKHITIDRKIKGTDQIGSLGPDGVNRMVRDIRLLEKSLGTKNIFKSDQVELSRKKLERSIATKRTIYKGEPIKNDDIQMLSPGDGYKWCEKDQVIGKKANKTILTNELIYPKDLCND